MKRRILRIIAVLIIFEIIFSSVIPSSIYNIEYKPVAKAEAADTMPDALNEYVLNIGTEFYQHNSKINIDRDMTIQLMYVNSEGSVIPITVASGSSIVIEWNVANNDVFTATGTTRNINGLKNFCEIGIRGIGYDNLTVKVTTTDGEGNSSQIDYSWQIYVTLAIDSSNLTDTTSGYSDYGLRYAFTTDKSKSTLQLMGPEVTSDLDTTNDKYNKYLLLLKVANLVYTFDDNGTEVTLNNFSTETDVEKSTVLKNLLEERIVWTTSDSSVVTVKYGVITAVGAGRAVVTATTSSEDGQSEDSVSINVVVKPTAYLVGSSNTTYRDSFTEIVNNSNFTINTNAVDATKLVWNIYNKDITGDLIWSTESSRTTDLMNVSVYDSSGSVYFSNVKAGTYYVTARVSDLYSENNTGIDKLEFTLIVPVQLPSGPIYMNVSDYYDIIENSTVPVTGWYSYSTNNVAVAKVVNGLITATGYGNTIITMNRLAGSGYLDYFNAADVDSYVPETHQISVYVIDNISINYSSAIIYTGSTLNLQAFTTNNTYVTWSSDNTSIATVTEDGTVTGLSEGQATITAKQVVAGVTKKATCVVTVRQSVTSITLSPSTKEMAVGDNLTINATVKPSLNGVSLKWVSSNDSVVSILNASDLSVNVTGLAGGTAVISAINQDNVVVGSCLINVYEPIASITLSQSTVTLPLSAGWFQLFATVNPSTAENQDIIWKSTDTSVATVDGNGIVTLVKDGKTSIIASSRVDATITAICNLTVTKSVTGIKLDKTVYEMYVGETYRMTYTITPTGASNATVQWSSSNTSIANVDSSGLISAKGVGTAVILAKTADGGFTATCTVTVGRTATAVKLDVTKLTLNVGDYYYLETTLTPADTTETTVTYETSDKSIAIVSKNGKVTGKSAGTCIVIAKTKSGSTAFCTVNVMQGVTGVQIDTEEAKIVIGEKFTITATVIPDKASNKTVAWSSSDASIASVNQYGEVEGNKGGVAVITCTTDEGGYVAYCIVTVEEEVTEIKLNYNYYKLGLNATFRLIAEISGETATNKQVVWSSSNSNIVSVDNNGRIKGLRMGTATITCEAADGSGASDTCEVEVCRLVTNIDLDVTYLTLIQGKSYTVTANVYPTEATYDVPIWTSEDNTIAIVDKNGVITALNPGSTIIRASANDTSEVSAICYVNVIAPVYATSISIAESEVVLSPGETKTVAISIVPNNSTETYSWSSDNTVVATVDSVTGQITAHEIGTANITVMTESGRKGTIKVYVVGLSRTYIELQQYTSLLLKLQVDGSGSSSLTVRWDVDNQEIANVSGGNVTAKALGTTTVYAVVNGRRMACIVKVVKIK